MASSPTSSPRVFVLAFCITHFNTCDSGERIGCAEIYIFEMDKIQYNTINLTYKDILVHRNTFQMFFGLGTLLFSLGDPTKIMNMACLKRQGDHNINHTQYPLVYFRRE